MPAGVVAVAALLAVAASMLGCFGGGAEEENEVCEALYRFQVVGGHTCRLLYADISPV